MSPKSILQFFKPKQQDLLVDSTNVDKRTADLCNEQLEQVYTFKSRIKKEGEISDFIVTKKLDTGEIQILFPDGIICG
jgi:hypothetical protein